MKSSAATWTIVLPLVISVAAGAAGVLVALLAEGDRRFAAFGFFFIALTQVAGAVSGLLRRITSLEALITTVSPGTLPARGAESGPEALNSGQ